MPQRFRDLYSFEPSFAVVDGAFSRIRGARILGVLSGIDIARATEHAKGKVTLGFLCGDSVETHLPLRSHLTRLNKPVVHPVTFGDATYQASGSFTWDRNQLGLFLSLLPDGSKVGRDFDCLKAALVLAAGQAVLGKLEVNAATTPYSFTATASIRPRRYSDALPIAQHEDELLPTLLAGLADSSPA